MINILLFNILLYLSVKNLLINIFEFQINLILYIKQLHSVKNGYKF